MKSARNLLILLIPAALLWSCAARQPPAPAFTGEWENSHLVRGGEYVTQISFDPAGTGQVREISHPARKGARKTADSAAIRPMHWHSDGEHYVILLYQPEGAGQVRLEWSISNDGKVLSLIHSDNSTDVYYRPGAQVTASGQNRVATASPPSESSGAGGDERAVGSAAPGPTGGEQSAEDLLEKL